MVYACMYYVYVVIKVASNFARDQLNRETDFSLTPFATDNLTSRDRFGCPVPSRPVPSRVSLLILYTQAESAICVVAVTFWVSISNRSRGRQVIILFPPCVWKQLVYYSIPLTKANIRLSVKVWCGRYTCLQLLLCKPPCCTRSSYGEEVIKDPHIRTFPRKCCVTAIYR